MGSVAAGGAAARRNTPNPSVRQVLEASDVVIEDREVRPAHFNPCGDLRQHALGVAPVVAHHDDGDVREGVHIVLADLGRGNVELLVDLREQRLEAAALLLQRGAARDLDFKRERGEMHRQSLTPGVARHKVGRVGVHITMEDSGGSQASAPPANPLPCPHAEIRPSVGRAFRRAVLVEWTHA